MVDPLLRARLAHDGVRVAAPVSRRGGAGPTNDGHLVIGGTPMALPVNPSSPFEVRDGRLWSEDIDLRIEADVVERPRFYDQLTSDGVEMHRLARLHGDRVLATTVVQTCARYTPDQRCRYCSIEESLHAGVTTRVKTPTQLAEVAEAAVRLDGVTQMVMTTGTAASADRGARYLARCVAAVKAAVPALPVQAQCEPPGEPGVLEVLRSSGVDSIGIHAESLDETVRARWMPGKATVPLAEYWAAWRESVALFGRNQVSTYLLIGLGEDLDLTMAGVADLAAIGVYPFVVPVRPGTGTLADADGLVEPDPAYVARVSAAVTQVLTSADMTPGGQKAGCAACGACSTVTPLTLSDRSLTAAR